MSASQLLLFAILGMGPGALIAGIALGLVLSYRGAGVTNFAIGAIAMLGGYEYYALRTLGQLFIPIPGVPLVGVGGAWPAVPAFLVALAVCALFGVGFDSLVLRRLRNASPLAKLIASVGLLLTLQAIAVEVFGTGGQSAPPVLPTTFIRFLSGGVPEDRFFFTGIVIVVTAGLVALYRYSRFGVATRAAAENESAAVLTGLRPQRISMVNTTLAFVLAGTLGILAAPASQLDPTTIPYAVIPALGAALIARFSSFGVAAIAGLAMGVIESEIIYLQTLSWFPKFDGLTLPGVTDLVFFVIIVVAVLLRGEKIPGRGALVEPRLPSAPRAQYVALPTTVAVGAGALLMIFTPPIVRGALTNTLLGALVCLSLGVIIGFVRQISLIQMGLGGIAGVIVAKLALESHIGFPAGPIVGIAVATTFGVVAALPALRVRGVNLAILTVAGMVAVQNFLLENSSFGAGSGGGLLVAEPKFFGLDLGPSGPFPGWDKGVPSPTFGLFCIATVLVFGLFVVSVRRNLLGQRMLAVRSNERAAAAIGISARNVKLVAFALSSFIGAVAGVMYAYNYASVTPDQYSATLALEFIAFAYLGGITTVRGAVMGGILAPGALVALAMSELNISSNWLFIIGGLGLILAVVYMPDGAALVPLRDQPPIALARLIARPLRARFRPAGVLE